MQLAERQDFDTPSPSGVGTWQNQPSSMISNSLVFNNTMVSQLEEETTDITTPILSLLSTTQAIDSDANRISRVSLSSDGTQRNNISSSPSISADGRYVVFGSYSSNLVGDDTNNYGGTFIHDRETGITTRISSSQYSSLSISASGRYVALGLSVYDTETGTTTRILEGTQPNGPSNNFVISADGRYVAFDSYATNLTSVRDLNRSTDVFIYDRLTGVLNFASPYSSPSGGSAPSISGDGRYTAYVGAGGIFVYNRETRTANPISPGTSPSISADGRYVAYESSASNLVANDTNNAADIFVYDQETGITNRVSISSEGIQANSGSSSPTISADGRYVAFASDATSLVARDTNGTGDIFVHDRLTGITSRISVSANGLQANGSSSNPAISADGHYVAFESDANNLVADDTNNKKDIFVYDFAPNVIDGTLGDDILIGKYVYDRITGFAGADILTGSAGSDKFVYTDIKDAGDTIIDFEAGKDKIVLTQLFQSFNLGSLDYVTAIIQGYLGFATLGQDTTLLIDPDGLADSASPIPLVTVQNISTEILNNPNNLEISSAFPDANLAIYSRTSRVSINSEGIQADSYSSDPAISADGRYVVFTSSAKNLVTSDTNGVQDIFVHDRLTGSTNRVSISTDGTQANGNSSNSTISTDGRYIAFASDAKNLIADDTNNISDIFVYDQETRTASRVSVGSEGIQGNSRSSSPSISMDGRYVSFTSNSSNLVSRDTNGIEDIFVHDRQTNITSRVSVGTGGIQANDRSSNSAISADGRYVAFTSDASNLVANDTNDSRDIFVHDRLTDITNRVSISTEGTQANNSSSSSLIRLSLSADGRYVAFESDASNLVADDTNNRSDIFVHDQQTGITSRVSINSEGIQANGNSSRPTISADGRYVAFASSATNLVADDTNNSSDIFIYDQETHTTSRVSNGLDGIQANIGSLNPAISASGRHVAFGSDARNLVVNDTNNTTDIFVYDFAPNTIDGTSSDDILIGTYAYDRITGFGGADILTGGVGSDEFVYTNIQDAGDTITDFEAGSDKIILTQLFQSLNLGSLNYLTANLQGYLSFAIAGNDTTVLIDPDGFAGSAAPTSLVTVSSVPLDTLNRSINFVM